MKLNVNKEEAINNHNLIVPIAYDEVFREIFGNPKNSVFTEYLVSALLNIPYDEVKGKIVFKSKDSDNIKVNKKKMEKDIVFVVDINKGHVLNLEMNLNDLSDIKKIRNTKYISDIFSNLLKPGDNEDSVKYVTQFNFNTEYADKKNKYIYDEYKYQNKKGNVLTNKIKIIHINIARMSELWYNKRYKRYKNISKIIFWFATLIIENEKSKLQELVDSSPINIDIAKDLERKVLTMNDDSELYGRYYNKEEEEKFWRDLERKELRKEAIAEGLAEGLAKGLAKGLAEGLLKGKLEKQTETILNMYEDNMDIKLIAKYNNISIEKVNEIISDNFNKKNKS